jgi:hypothetical protein
LVQTFKHPYGQNNFIEKWEFTFVGVCENGEKLKGLAAASLRLKTLNDNP